LYKTLNSVEAHSFNLIFTLFPYFSISQRTIMSQLINSITNQNLYPQSLTRSLKECKDTCNFYINKLL